MNTLKLVRTLVAGMAVCVMVAGCSTASKSPEVSDKIRKDLKDANFGDVSVSQDRDKGVVTLGGHVTSDADKAQAESIAKADAAGQVVADEIAIDPPGADKMSTVNSDLDKAIDKNLDAALIQSKLDKDVRYDVKNGVVTLKGEVNSEAKRAKVQNVASKVPNVQQVVNELQVKNQKASSSK
jgi:hyperosmotically inducible periplasmic protein